MVRSAPGWLPSRYHPSYTQFPMITGLENPQDLFSPEDCWSEFSFISASVSFQQVFCGTPKKSVDQPTTKPQRWCDRGFNLPRSPNRHLVLGRNFTIFLSLGRYIGITIRNPFQPTSIIGRHKSFERCSSESLIDCISPLFAPSTFGFSQSFWSKWSTEAQDWSLALLPSWLGWVFTFGI